MNFKNKKILVCVTGGIAAYKSCSLVNKLISLGAEVRVVMTDAATKFVSPLTFQTLTNQPVYTDIWTIQDPNSVEHISVSHWPDLIVISPATANTINKIASGIADNLLTTVILAKIQKTKVIMAPAMNTNMWENPITQQNLEKLRSLLHFVIVEPRSGVLSCRDEGKGKIADTDSILEEISKVI